jgi:flagellar biosynthetic protein FliP
VIVLAGGKARRARSGLLAAGRGLARGAALALALVLWTASPSAQVQPQGPPPPAAAQAQGSGPSLTLQLRGGAAAPDNLGSALEIVLLMTALSMAPAILMTMTCFTRIIIVLSFLKRALSLQELPPALVVTGFSLFLTIFVMKPVADDLYRDAYRPYVSREIGFDEAAQRATARMNAFMLKQTRPEDLKLIIELGGGTRPATPADVPFHVAVPAFVLSEIKTAFQMGFVLFLPFVVIDLVISALLISMGMFTLPPVVVSTPLKLLLFILVDGWDLVVASLAESFAQP